MVYVMTSFGPLVRCPCSSPSFLLRLAPSMYVLCPKIENLVRDGAAILVLLSKMYKKREMVELVCVFFFC